MEWDFCYKAPENIGEQELFNQLYQEVMHKDQMLFVGSLLQRAADKYNNKTALICNDKTISYKELYWRAVRLSRRLQELDVRPHDRVLVFLDNSIEFYIAYFAVLQIGGIVAPLNTLLYDTELIHIVNDARPAVMIVSTVCAKRLKRCEEITLCPLLTEVDIALESEIDVSVVHNFDIIELYQDHLAVLLYTSGTTGLPKGVMLSSKNIITNVIQSVSRMSFYLQSDDKLLGVLPLFHSFSQFACVWAALFFGTTVILVPKIDRKHILEGLRHKPTIFLGVPALYGLLCLMKTAPLDSIRYFVSGGDALSDKIRGIFALLYRRKICSGYGLTEASPVVSVFLDDELHSTQQVGHLLPGIKAQIRDEDSIPMEDGVVGELWVKGDNVMLGYYKDRVLTRNFLQEGWLRTGDLAYFDQKGRIIIAGRLKDLIIHKGFNIYPAEIENVIAAHPDILRVAVVGIRTDIEEMPVAYVQLRRSNSQIKRELKALCRQRLAPYKRPRRFVISTKDLPITATGKVNKNALRLRAKELEER